MTTFISYSRVNSDFAVRLAQDLKLAGFDVWLDQLDIPTGARWDDEIEKALEACDTFMIVLSPKSIQSQNVKDEIGYAIDTGKHILPVVLEDCQVPLRVRRFQYVDFSDDSYEESLSTIKTLLGRTSEPEKKKKGGDQLVMESNRSRIGKDKPDEGTKSNSGSLIAAAGIVLIALAVIFGQKLIIPNTGSTPSSLPIPPTEMDAPISPSDIPVITPPTDTRFPVEMVTVPKGSFIMGADNKDVMERPAHRVDLKAYFIDKYEVTNKQYQVCVDARGCNEPVDFGSKTRPSYYGNDDFGDYPVVNVSWEMARSYCEWRGARLPTEAEWEKAARGVDERTYPWGEGGVDCDKANYNACTGKDTSPVDKHAPGQSPYGVFDMAGNVWEWVADRYQENYYSTIGANSSNPSGPDEGSERVIRGGSWFNSSKSLYTTLRNFSDPSKTYNYVGFRCAKD